MNKKLAYTIIIILLAGATFLCTYFNASWNDSLDESNPGETTSRPIINMNNYFTCEARLLGNSDDALVIYAENEEMCGKGKSILGLEKFKGRDTSGVANYDVIDTVHVSSSGKGITISFCKKEKKEYVVSIEDYTKEDFGKIWRAWTFDEKQGKLIEVDPANLDVVNEFLIGECDH